MAYDEEWAERVRELLADRAGIREMAMFGGLAFLVGGHMGVAVSGRGGLMVRCDPDEESDLLAEPGVEPMEMRGRPMRGWLRVALPDEAPDPVLARWVRIGADYAGSLPPKS